MKAYPEMPIAAVCAAVTRNGEILLIRRGYEPCKGLWAMPGGSVESGESLTEAVERETLEETGLTVNARDCLGSLDFIEKDDRDRVKFHYVITYYRCDYVSGTAHGASDALEARWFGKTELPDLPITPNAGRMLRKLQFLP